MQRIEAWWSQLKKSFTEWWIELFQVRVQTVYKNNYDFYAFIGV
jgi:hypothetical protein